VIGLIIREGAIIERVRTGTPARWASNRENPLALLECGGIETNSQKSTCRSGAGHTFGKDRA
jgi:hypothetical protein